MRRRGEKLLRLAGLADEAAARVVDGDAAEPGERRCLAARAIGYLEDGELAAPETGGEPAHSRARWRAFEDFHRRGRIRAREERERRAAEGGATPGESLAVLLDPRAEEGRRARAAAAIGAGRWREAAWALLAALREDARPVRAASGAALREIGSRRGGRELIALAGDRSAAEEARVEAIQTIWILDERRAADTLARVALDAARESEWVRQRAAEALGVAADRPRVQRVLARLVTDESAVVRYSALCACGMVMGRLPAALREAVGTRLGDSARLDEDRGIAELAASVLDREKAG